MKTIQQTTTEKILHYNEIDWNNFLFSFKEPEIRILEIVYNPEPKTIIYRHIYETFKNINYSNRSARRIINKLAKLGLIIKFTSTMGIIKPVNELTSNIQSLISLFRSRQEHTNPVKQKSYDEIAKLIMEEKEW